MINDPCDTLNLEQWLKAAPLESAQSQMREFRATNEAADREWLAGLAEEDRLKLIEVRALLFDSVKRNTETDTPEMSSVVSPVTLAYIEQFRSQKNFPERGWPTKPVDVFVWALGEAPQRWFTKIGGVPYRPAALPWPTIPPSTDAYPVNVGAPMTFLAQFNFAASRDLFPHLPGDVLLVFAEDDTFSRPEGIYVEWHHLEIPLDQLLTAGDQPASAWKFVTCHGYRHRTLDYRAEIADEFDWRNPPSAAAIIDATKIGGYPALMQSTNTEFDSFLNETASTFLAQIRSIFPPSNQYYPWMNQQPPEDSNLGDRLLNLVDDGSIYLIFNSDGQVTWEFQCG